MPEEDLIEPEFHDEFGDYDYVGEYLIDEQYGEFESMMDQLKHDVYNLVHFGHEDGPEAYAAECYGEEQLALEMSAEQDWQDHLDKNPIQKFEEQKTFEMEVLGMYPDSHDRYEYMDLIGQEAVDDNCPVPSEDQCQY